MSQSLPDCGGDFQCFAQICGLSAKLVVSLFPITKNIIFIRLLFMAYNLLKGKRGIIFGALNDASIAWKVAERASEEGAQIVLTNTPVAAVWVRLTNWRKRPMQR